MGKGLASLDPIGWSGWDCREEEMVVGWLAGLPWSGWWGLIRGRARWGKGLQEVVRLASPPIGVWGTIRGWASRGRGYRSMGCGAGGGKGHPTLDWGGRGLLGQSWPGRGALGGWLASHTPSLGNSLAVVDVTGHHYDLSFWLLQRCSHWKKCIKNTIFDNALEKSQIKKSGISILPSIL